MTWEQFLDRLGDTTVFRVDQLDDDGSLNQQTKRWADNGWLARLHRGIYRLEGVPQPHPFLLSNLIAPDSYVSGLSALDYHRFLTKPYEGPVTAVTSKRARTLTIEGVEFQYIKITNPVSGELAEGQPYRLATPEAAVFDLMHRKSGQPRFRQGEMHYEKFDQEKVWNLVSHSRDRKVAGYLTLRIRQAQQIALRRAKGTRQIG